MTKNDLEELINSTPQWLKDLAEMYPPSFARDTKPKLTIVTDGFLTSAEVINVDKK